MLPSSAVRRVATAAAPQAPAISNLAASSTAASSRSIAFAVCRPSSHQRRFSSSKPSSPSDGAKDLPAVKSTQLAKSAGEKRKPGRKPKDSQAVASHKVPSVPSTQHLPLESVALSSFFSLHRPISITHSLPKTTTDDAFASIFAARTKAQKSSDVINTLSRTVKELEGPMASMTLNQPDAGASEDQVHKIDLKHPDGSESSVYIQLNSMSGQFLPFQPPPAPKPTSEADAVAAEAVADGDSSVAELDQEPQRRTYKAVLTIEEQIDANGEVKIVAHSPEVIMDEPAPAPRTFLERMALRHLRYEDARRERERARRQQDPQERRDPAAVEEEEQQFKHDVMEAISVRRRQKLKIKKKKYKKLMKRTRNERRKLDRI